MTLLEQSHVCLYILYNSVMIICWHHDDSLTKLKDSLATSELQLCKRKFIEGLSFWQKHSTTGLVLPLANIFRISLSLRSSSIIAAHFFNFSLTGLCAPQTSQYKAKFVETLKRGDIRQTFPPRPHKINFTKSVTRSTLECERHQRGNFDENSIVLSLVYIGQKFKWKLIPQTNWFGDVLRRSKEPIPWEGQFTQTTPPVGQKNVRVSLVIPGHIKKVTKSSGR